MKYLHVPLLLSLLTACGGSDHPTKPLGYLLVELKAPSQGFPAAFRLALVASDSVASSSTYGTRLALPSGLPLLTHSFLLFSRPNAFGFVAVEERSSPSPRSLVWALSDISPTLSSQWSPWRPPDLLETSGQPSWNLLNKRTAEHRMSGLPPGTYSARFRFLIHPFPPESLPARTPWPTVIPAPQ